MDTQAAMFWVSMFGMGWSKIGLRVSVRSHLFMGSMQETCLLLFSSLSDAAKVDNKLTPTVLSLFREDAHFVSKWALQNKIPPGAQAKKKAGFTTRIRQETFKRFCYLTAWPWHLWLRPQPGDKRLIMWGRYSTGSADVPTRQSQAFVCSDQVYLPGHCLSYRLISSEGRPLPFSL